MWYVNKWNAEDRDKSETFPTLKKSFVVICDESLWVYKLFPILCVVLYALLFLLYIQSLNIFSNWVNGTKSKKSIAILIPLAEKNGL